LCEPLPVLVFAAALPPAPVPLPVLVFAVPLPPAPVPVPVPVPLLVVTVVLPLVPLPSVTVALPLVPVPVPLLVVALALPPAPLPSVMVTVPLLVVAAAAVPAPARIKPATVVDARMPRRNRVPPDEARWLLITNSPFPRSRHRAIRGGRSSGVSTACSSGQFRLVDQIDRTAEVLPDEWLSDPPPTSRRRR